MKRRLGQAHHAGGGRIDVFDATHQRQQADGDDQFQGRDQGREHRDGEELTPHSSSARELVHP
jgi:hypothetical protein